MEEHKKDLDPANPRLDYTRPTPYVRDLIDSYLIEMETSEDPEFHAEQCVMVGMDLMGAGSDVRPLAC
jgi:hypothetical protein